jgi:hypothetical protein
MYGSVRKSVVTYSAPFLLLNAAANYFRLGIVIRDSHHSRVDVRIDHLDAGILLYLATVPMDQLQLSFPPQICLLFWCRERNEKISATLFEPAHN